MKMELPEKVQSNLDDFLSVAKAAFGENLKAAVLYGSAAHGQLRATSDVNLILVLERFVPAEAERLSEAMRVAQATMQLTVMYLLQSEIPSSAESFAPKFDGILHQRRILFGADPFAGVVIPREAAIAQLKRVLRHWRLHLRDQYVRQGLREEQLALVIADSAGPLRASAATLLELEGHTADSPKSALERIADEAGEKGWQNTLAQISQARETRLLPPGVAKKTIVELMALCQTMVIRAERLT